MIRSEAVRYPWPIQFPAAAGVTPYEGQETEWWVQFPHFSGGVGSPPSYGGLERESEGEIRGLTSPYTRIKITKGKESAGVGERTDSIQSFEGWPFRLSLSLRYFSPVGQTEEEFVWILRTLFAKRLGRSLIRNLRRRGRSSWPFCRNFSRVLSLCAGKPNDSLSTVHWTKGQRWGEARSPPTGLNSSFSIRWCSLHEGGVSFV